jgi:hypothetical protein
MPRQKTRCGNKEITAHKNTVQAFPTKKVSHIVCFSELGMSYAMNSSH